MPTVSAFVLFVGDERWQLSKRFITRIFRNGNVRVGVERHTFWLRKILFGVGIFCVCRKKGDVQNERLVYGFRLQELQCIPFVLRRDVNLSTLRLLHPMGSAVRSAEVEFILRKFAVVPLAYQSCVVAIVSKQTWIRLVPRSFKFLKGRVSVSRHPLAGEKRCSTHSTNGRCHVVVGKPYALAR